MGIFCGSFRATLTKVSESSICSLAQVAVGLGALVRIGNRCKMIASYRIYVDFLAFSVFCSGFSRGALLEEENVTQRNCFWVWCEMAWGSRWPSMITCQSAYIKTQCRDILQKCNQTHPTCPQVTSDRWHGLTLFVLFPFSSSESVNVSGSQLSFGPLSRFYNTHVDLWKVCWSETVSPLIFVILRCCKMIKAIIRSRPGKIIHLIHFNT